MSASTKSMIDTELRMLLQENENLFKQREELREQVKVLTRLLSPVYRALNARRTYSLAAEDWSEWLEDAKKALKLNEK